jgi:hypothetical protein
MPQPELIALVGASYGATLFAVHRMGVWRRRAEGPDLKRLRRFDFRVLMRDLEPVYRAGLPREPSVPVEWPSNASVSVEPPALESPWESPSLMLLRHARDAFFLGEPVESVPGPEFISLVVHAWARWLARNDPSRARAVASALLDLSPTIAAKLLGYADLLEADAAVARGEYRVAYRDVSRAVQRLRSVGSAASDADLSSRYLDAHLSLAHLTNGWNLEYAVFQARRFLTRAVRDLGHVPCLYLVLALAAAQAGRSEEAVDELGRAVYYSQGDVFYARVAVDDDYIARVRPVLVAQCRDALVRAVTAAQKQPLAPRDRVS